ncbi:MAG: TIGR00730 family Rossman fold protein [Bacteroidota bacterium]
MDSVAVFCGSSLGVDGKVTEEAIELGKYIAAQNIMMVYGGARIGLMGKIADGALQNKGKVIGVIPTFLKSKEIFHEGLTELIVVETMHERKTRMHELSDGFIALPGGFGTLEELFEIVTWAQLGLHQKPIGVLNVNGFFDSMFQFLDNMVSKGFLKPENREMIIQSESYQDLLEQMKSYSPKHVTKWIEKEQT